MRSSASRALLAWCPGAPPSSSACSGPWVRLFSSRISLSSPSSPRRVIAVSRARRLESSLGSSCSAGLWGRSRQAPLRPPSGPSAISSPRDPSTSLASSPSWGSHTSSGSENTFAIREVPQSLGYLRSESSSERLRDGEEPGDDANRHAEDRGQHAGEDREFLAMQVHQHEQKEREEPRSGADQDDDPA